MKKNISNDLSGRFEEYTLVQLKRERDDSWMDFDDDDDDNMKTLSSKKNIWDIGSFLVCLRQDGGGYIMQYFQMGNV